MSLTLSVNNSLSEWLTWLEKLHPSEIDLGLSRIRVVAKNLGLLTSVDAMVITVGGTNGKGSCVATMEALLLDKEQTVGAYTSPHLISYNERIKINGTPVVDQDIVEAFDLINHTRQETSLTYFEFGTLAALLLFKKYKVKYWLLEVGLGGRLDAVNILDADIAVITSIDLDHTEWLGETREQIATEKAGILRRKQKVICAEKTPPKTLIKAFSDNNVDLFQIGRDFNYLKHSNELCEIEFFAQSEKKIVFSCRPPQLPLTSAIAAVQALMVLRLTFNENDITRAWNQLNLSGRFSQLAYRGCTIIFDVAHNPAATQFLYHRLQQTYSLPCRAVLACMKDKNIRAILAPLMDGVEKWYLAEIPDLPRSAKANDLSDELVQLKKQSELDISQYASVAEAIDTAVVENNTANMPIVVFGSFYTVGAAIEHIREHKI